MSEKQAGEMVSLEKAKRQVAMVCERLALLHLAFARTMVDELGEEKGRELVLKAIKKYGNYIGEEVRKGVIAQGLEPDPANYGAGTARDLPEFGMHDGMEKVQVEGETRVRARGCVMGKVWEKYGESELGRLYCYIDPAKYMSYNPEGKLVHTKAIPDGDDCCELVVRPTTEKERADFAEDNTDWSYIDA